MNDTAQPPPSEEDPTAIVIAPQRKRRITEGSSRAAGGPGPKKEKGRTDKNRNEQRLRALTAFPLLSSVPSVVKQTQPKL